MSFAECRLVVTRLSVMTRWLSTAVSGSRSGPLLEVTKVALVSLWAEALLMAFLIAVVNRFWRVSFRIADSQPYRPI